LVAVALCLLLAPTASAEQFGGTGTIWAKGAGLAILRGDDEINGQEGLWSPTGEVIGLDAVPVTQ